MTEGHYEGIVVVGVCGAGKTTLVQGLTAIGYPARVCAQEHSGVPLLWRRHGQPRVLLLLHAGLETVRRRLQVPWEEAIYVAQQARLEEARRACDLAIDTDPLSVGGVRQQAVDFLRARHLFEPLQPPLPSPATG